MKLPLSTLVLSLFLANFVGDRASAQLAQSSGSLSAEIAQDPEQAKSSLSKEAPTEAQIWTHALAFSAVLDSRNGYLHSTLSVTNENSMDPRQRGLVQQTLSQAWGIHTRTELLAMLDKLQSGEVGSRHGYWDIRHALLEAKMENYGPMINSSENDEAARILIVATHLFPLKGKTMPIIAWDFGRYIFLCRTGYDAGFLTEGEAWSRILPAARLLQSAYSSWSEFAADYLVGRNFWNPSTAAENNDIRFYITMMNCPPYGLWSTVPWSQSLGDGSILQDTLAEGIFRDYQEPDANGVPLTYFPPEGPLRVMLKTSIDGK